MDTFQINDQKKFKQPSPLDFDIFLPWACHQLQVKVAVHVTKVVRSDYVSVTGLSDRSKKKGKSNKTSKIEMNLDLEKEDQSYTGTSSIPFDRGLGVQIIAIYDIADHLVQLKLQNNKLIPRTIFKLLNLIIKYHKYLNTITINEGLDQYTLYDINKFLPYSYITVICLDDTYLKEANYHILLGQKSVLRHLSLSRCSLNDTVIEALAGTLTYPSPGSQSLSILNLSSNRITDAGAKYLAEALRSNRKLSYLNLADNNLTDCGGGYLLNTLVEFPLTFSELVVSRSRHMTYLKEKNDLMIQIVKDLLTGDADKRGLKRKSARPVANPKKKGGLEKEGSAKSLPEAKNYANMDNSIIFAKARTMAENSLGVFKDPFDKNNTSNKEGIIYSVGNDVLCYLNLAYNSLTYVTVKKLLGVLNYQREMGRPRGLINLSIEGNYMPVACKELTQIDNLIEMGLMTQNRRLSLQKKRQLPKSGGR